MQISPSLKAIKELHAICNSDSSCTPYVAYIPNSDYWRPNQKANDYKLFLKNIANDLSIEFLDGSIAIDSNEKVNYSPSGHHLSKVGYRKMAEFLASELN